MSVDLTPSLLDRARGALLGQLVGDALGTTLEFQSAASILKRYPNGLRDVIGGGPFKVLPGQVTDDSELALGLARSLAGAGDYDADAVAGAYVAWYRSEPFDVGGTIGQAFRGATPTGAGAAATVLARANHASQANGALMRVAPLAIWGWTLAPARLAALAAFDARLSHPHPACQDANVAYTHAIALALRERLPAEEVHARTLAFAGERDLDPDVVAVLEDAAAGPPADYVANMGWYRIALQNAFHQLLAAPSFEEGLVATVAAGGDTDTNGCIAGALLGAVHGEERIPARWRQVVLACRTDRGADYQARDARELAEALAAAGARPAAQQGGALPVAGVATPLVDDDDVDLLAETGLHAAFPVDGFDDDDVLSPTDFADEVRQDEPQDATVGAAPQGAASEDAVFVDEVPDEPGLDDTSEIAWADETDGERPGVEAPDR